MGGHPYVCPWGRGDDSVSRVHPDCLLLSHHVRPSQNANKTLSSYVGLSFLRGPSWCTAEQVWKSVYKRTWSEICLKNEKCFFSALFHLSMSSRFLPTSSISYYIYLLILLTPLLHFHHPFLYSSNVTESHRTDKKKKKKILMSAASVFRTEINILISVWLWGMVIRNQHSLFDSRLGYHWYLLLKGNTSVLSEV